MKYVVLSIALILFVSVSCRQVNSPEVGTIKGRITIADVDGSPLNVSLAGSKVTLKGTSISAVTDSLGNYTLKNVPAGIYAIRFSRADFYTVGSDHYEFSGAGVDFIPEAQLVRMSTDALSLDQAKLVNTFDYYHQPTRYLTFSGHISSSQKQSYMLWCSTDLGATWGGVGSTIFEGGNYTNPGVMMYGEPTGLVRFDSLQKGSTLLVRTELFPSVPSSPPSIYEDVVHDYSNIVSITVP